MQGGAADISRLEGRLGVPDSLEHKSRVMILTRVSWGRRGERRANASRRTPLTFLSRFHAGNKVVAFVLAIVLVGIIQRHAHTFELVPFVPNVPSSDWVLDALLFGP